MPYLVRIQTLLVVGTMLLVHSVPVRGQEETNAAWVGKLADGTEITHEQLSKILLKAKDRLDRAAVDAVTGATQLASMTGADLRTADLTKANLNGADLRKADLAEANLRQAHLRGADLRGANLMHADLRAADLEGALLGWADLREADLERSDLRGHLREADLRGAKLKDADLRAADLKEADLRGADLTETDLEEADLQGAYLRDAQGLTLQQLSEVKTLYNAKLDRELMEQVNKTFHHLLEKPIEHPLRENTH
jgi:uncharacterized protein YjbI with pentapeptide repeats